MTANAGELSREREEPAMVAQEPRKQKEKKEKKSLFRKKVIDNSEKSAYSDLKKTKTVLTEQEQTIVALLAGGQRLVDDVIAESGKATGAVLASLTLLEVKGVVRRLPGRFIELTGK
jgi:predicted Rossmann fold nucleotide-binding protein DprA/Smf involved in DNA uptake